MSSVQQERIDVHATGRNRGLLCHGCNVAAGFLRDDSDRAIALAVYLKGGQ
jgi:hypothetical protein